MSNWTHSHGTRVFTLVTDVWGGGEDEDTGSILTWGSQGLAIDSFSLIEAPPWDGYNKGG